MSIKTRWYTAEGRAKLTATTQYFLDTCPAVIAWTADEGEETATFVYDTSIEVPLVPDGVSFDDLTARND